MGVPLTDNESMVEQIRDELFLVDDAEHHSFGTLDIRGDLDAFWLFKTLNNSDSTLTGAFTEYFTESLNDEFRAGYFVNTRFPGKITREELREVVLACYRENTLVEALEASRGLPELEGIDAYRIACCYVYADWCQKTMGWNRKKRRKSRIKTNSERNVFLLTFKRFRYIIQKDM